MAGRKNKHTVDYFPHYCNGESKTMFIVEKKFGLIGYAVWYKTLEILGRTDNHFIDLRDETDMLFLISKLGITEDKFVKIYDLLAKLGAIDIELWCHKVVFSDNFVSNIEDAYARRKGIYVLHKYDLCKHLLIKCEHKRANKSKVNKSKVNKSKKDLVFPYQNLEFLETWKKWKLYKKAEFGFSFKSEISEQASLNKLERISKNENEAINLINTAIENGWKGFFKNKKNGSNSENIRGSKPKIERGSAHGGF